MRGSRADGTVGLVRGLRGWRVPAVGLPVAVAFLLVLSAPAGALLHRGHEAHGSYGSEGTVTLSKPSGVAVNEATGDSYVLDSGHNRVIHYGAHHEVLQVWGAGVKTAESKVYEVCTPPEACLSGVAGFGKGQFDEPVAIAVDNAKGSPSNGDVYVVANGTAKKAVIDKFSANGELIARLLASKEEHEEFEENPIVGVAVGPTGTVWVDREAEEEEVWVQRLGNGVNNAPLGVPVDLSVEQLAGPARPGFAVDGKGGVYVTYEPGGHTLEEREEEEEELKEEEKELKIKGLKPQLPCEKHPCLAVKLALTEKGEELEATAVVNPLDAESSSGIAVDLSQGSQSSADVYLDNLDNVNAFNQNGTPIQSFGSGELKAGKGIAVDAATNEVLVPDSAAGVVDVFTASKPAPPEIQTGSPGAARVTSTSVELRATIDPRGGTTHYRFQYGTANCEESEASCQEVPAADSPPATLGNGFGDVNVSQLVTGLTPGTKYFIRVLAEYEFEEEGVVKQGTVASEQRSFSTLNSALEPALPDGRAWEQVSPELKHGASIDPSTKEGGLTQAAADGKRLAYITTAPLGEGEPEGYRGPERTSIFAQRGPNGWANKDIAVPNKEAVGVRIGLPREYRFFSEELDLGVLEPPDDQKLSPRTTETTAYLRHNLTCAIEPETCFEPLVTAENDTAGTQFGRFVRVAGGTPDMKKLIIYMKNTKITPDGGTNGLYEWSEGVLTPVNVLPNGTVTNTIAYLGASGLNLSVNGGEGRMTETAISNDGNRVEWNEENNPHLYQRIVSPTPETLQADEVQAGAPQPKTFLNAVFQTASTDGSKVFFTDSTRLTSNSKAPGSPASPDLYVFEPGKPAGQRVTDLSVPLNAGESANVQGAIIGASENGSYVYFVANGVLNAGAKPGNCSEAGATGCNLYVAHDGPSGWERPELIARVSSKDNPDWGEPNGAEHFHLQFKTSEVSPDGQYVAFMSQERLTGYNNTDANSGVPDEEVFLYGRHETKTETPSEVVENEAGEEEEVGGEVTETAHPELLCPSCNPSGAQPIGLFDTEESSEGRGPLVDRSVIWAGQLTETTARWLAGSVPGWTAYDIYGAAYQPRYLSDSGRLFFNSADSLVPRDTNTGKEDVYEFEPEGIGSCSGANTQGGCLALISGGQSERETAFLDASANGNDVFFLTSAKLTPSDTDTGLDIYDARVCEGNTAEPCPTPAAPKPPACTGEACRPAATGQESFETPASLQVGASGNVASHVLGTKTEEKPKPKTETKAQKLAKALKTCHKIKSKKKRVSCEKHARKLYGSKASVKKTTAKKAKKAAKR